MLPPGDNAGIAEGANPPLPQAAEGGIPPIPEPADATVSADQVAAGSSHAAEATTSVAADAPNEESLSPIAPDEYTADPLEPFNTAGEGSADHRNVEKTPMPDQFVHFDDCMDTYVTELNNETPKFTSH